MCKCNWFDTLNGALEAESLIDHWDCLWAPISYGETRQWDFEHYGYLYHASIYRESDGRYERPVWYKMCKAPGKKFLGT